MEQAALSGLIGAKLEEKQALVRNAFPNASLTPINKATEPLSNNSIPLIQSMFKLPVITDTPKAITTEAKQIKQSVFTDTPLKVLANAVKPVPSPLVPVESQNAFKSRDNNLSINLSTGKSVPSKDPVPMPNVSWGKPAEVVTMNPIVAKLPQYKAVATFVGDGDTFSAKSDSYATKGEKAKKAGGILCRVDSVDAPETEHKGYGSFKGKLGQPYGEEAGKKLRDMILNKEISIRIVRPSNGDPNEPGLYGRDICQIEVEGVNVSTELIRAGAAWLYREYNNYFTGLETVEANAKAEGRGLFSDPNAVYPPTAKHNGSLNLR
jgi:endonuclease YncB( thermonuclease family)